jgi:hypothetical protein
MLSAGPPAQAGERGGLSFRFHGSQRAYDHSRPHGLGPRYDWRSPYKAFRFRDRSPGYGSPRTDRRSCRIVTKSAVWHGRPAKIAGTLCYDRHGRPYIVPGSRRVIGRYD